MDSNLSGDDVELRLRGASRPEQPAEETSPGRNALVTSKREATGLSPGTADGHRRASSYWSVTHFSSALEQLTMARDPDLQRFASHGERGSGGTLVGQFHTVLQDLFHIGIPWQPQ